MVGNWLNRVDKKFKARIPTCISVLCWSI
jgi:hypothetical protein